MLFAHTRHDLNRRAKPFISRLAEVSLACAVLSALLVGHPGQAMPRPDRTITQRVADNSGIYRHRDAEGRVSYEQWPSAAASAVQLPPISVVEGGAAQATRGAQTNPMLPSRKLKRTQSDQTNAATPDDAFTDTQREAKRRTVVRDEGRDVNRDKSPRCPEWRAQLTQAQRDRYVYSRDVNGALQLLDDAEKKQYITRLEHNLEKHCQADVTKR